MEACFHGELVCMWFSCEHVFLVRSFHLVDSLWINHKVVTCVMQCVTCHLFSNSFNFCTQLLNSVLVGTVCMTFEIVPKEIITEIHAQWKLVAGDHPHLKYLGHGYWTHHAGHPRWHCLYVGVHHPAGKMLFPLPLLPEWLKWPHFAVVVDGTGLIWCPPQRSAH